MAALWGAVLVYWLWTRRPSTADTVGSFHRELRVLERATPARVVPANRLTPHPRVEDQPGLAPDTAVLPPQVAVAAAFHKRTELRRRRRDVLGMLVVAALVTMLAAALSHSAVALGFQVGTDLALAAYLFLLYNAMRARAPVGFEVSYDARLYSSPRSAPMETNRRTAFVLQANALPFAHFAPRAPVRRAGGSGVPISALTTGPMVAVAPAPPVGAAPTRARYGDFDSYSSLA